MWWQDNVLETALIVLAAVAIERATVVIVAASIFRVLVRARKIRVRFGGVCRHPDVTALECTAPLRDCP